MLTSTPSRSHRSTGRTVVVVVTALVVVAALVGAGYAAARSGLAVSHPAAAAPSRTPAEPPSPTASPSASSPAPSTPPTSDVVSFTELPVGAPPDATGGDDHYPWHRLTVTLRGPSTVAAGGTADFTVRLRNPTAAAISLEPCPSYDITVGPYTTSYGLNCPGAASDVIGPGSSLSFDVQVTIPYSVTSGGKVDVAWSLGWQPDRTSPRDHRLVKVAG